MISQGCPSSQISLQEITKTANCLSCFPSIAFTLLWIQIFGDVTLGDVTLYSKDLDSRVAMQSSQTQPQERLELFPSCLLL